MKRKTIAGLIVIAILAAVVMFAGCVEDETLAPTPSPTPTPSPEPKYVIGDTIASDNESRDKEYVEVVLQYDKDTDEYEIILFCMTDQQYVGFIDRYSRTCVERLYPVIVGHLDVSTVDDTPKYDPRVGEVTVRYVGDWSGSYGDIGSIKSVEGHGTKTFYIKHPDSHISASFIKKDDSSNTLLVSIYYKGQLLNGESTKAAYGMVTVSGTIKK